MSMTTDELTRLHNQLDRMNEAECGLRAGTATKLIRELLALREDAARLDYLEKLLRHCPHAEIGFNDDPDTEDAHGMRPVGFRIRVEGCETSDVCAPTIRNAIDLEIAASAARQL